MEKEKGGEFGSESMALDWIMKMLQKNLDEEAKKQLMRRMLDERILLKECEVKTKQVRLETLQMMKQLLEK
jgi:hypothetical protein